MTTNTPTNTSDDENTTCPYCGEDYSDPNGIASADYMYHGHILFDCSNPDLMELAFLNAPAVERMEAWA